MIRHQTSEPPVGLSGGYEQGSENIKVFGLHLFSARLYFPLRPLCRSIGNKFSESKCTIAIFQIHRDYSRPPENRLGGFFIGFLLYSATCHKMTKLRPE